MPGDLVRENAVVLEIWGVGSLPDPLSLLKCVEIGIDRDFRQDPLLGFRLLNDIALRAVSAAIKDPASAIQAIDSIESLLMALVVRDLAIGVIVDHTYPSGDLRRARLGGIPRCRSRRDRRRYPNASHDPTTTPSDARGNPRRRTNRATALRRTAPDRQGTCWSNRAVSCWLSGPQPMSAPLCRRRRVGRHCYGVSAPENFTVLSTARGRRLGSGRTCQCRQKTGVGPPAHQPRPIRRGSPRTIAALRARPGRIGVQQVCRSRW